MIQIARCENFMLWYDYAETTIGGYMKWMKRGEDSKSQKKYEWPDGIRCAVCVWICNIIISLSLSLTHTISLHHTPSLSLSVHVSECLPINTNEKFIVTINSIQHLLLASVNWYSCLFCCFTLSSAAVFKLYLTAGRIQRKMLLASPVGLLLVGAGWMMYATGREDGGWWLGRGRIDDGV